MRYLILFTLLIFGCASEQQGGMLPVYEDEYVLTTEERYFELDKNLIGVIILHQESYPCTTDTIIYNSTSIVKLLDGDTITVYSPCATEDLKTDEAVQIKPVDYNKDLHWTIRDILVQFPRQSENHPYYECISCKFPNTIGEIKAIK